MVKKRNRRNLILVLFITISAALGLFKFSIIDISKIQESAREFHYNAISTSAVIGGFLFTGISILISTLDLNNERIKRLWENDYLDNQYRTAFVGIIANILTIVCAVILLICSTTPIFEEILLHVEVITLLLGIVFFSWCVLILIRIVPRLKGWKN